MKTRILSAFLAGALLFSGIGEFAVPAQAVDEQAPAQTESSVAAQTISIHPEQLWMRTGEQTQLTASVLPEDVTDSISWSSSDTAVCSVNNTGTVTAQGNGSAVLTAQIGTVSATCTVSVGLTAPKLSDIVIDAQQHVTLSWEAVPDCDGYRISRRASKSDAWEDVETLTGTSWTDTSMTATPGWQYGVRSYKLRNSQTDDEETLWSDYALREVPVIEQPPQTESLARPAMPKLISAETLSSGGIRVSWNAVSGASGYRVYRKNGSEWDLLHIIKNASTTSYIDPSPYPSTTYTYTVCSFSRGGKKILLSDYDTAGVSATTASISIPKLGQVTSSAYDRLTVTWSESHGAEGYVVYRRTSPTGTWENLTTVTNGATTSYTDTTVTCGQTYYYTVSAYCTVNGKKVYSGYNKTGISGQALPAAPTLKSAVPASGSSITFTWNTVSGASGYRMYRKTGTSGSWVCIGDLMGSTRNTYTNTGLKAGQLYYYTVAAFCKLPDGTIVRGPYNDTGIRSVPLAAPTLKSAASAGATSITFTWDTVSGASGYRMYRRTSTSGAWVCIGDLTGSTRNSYTNSGLTTGQRYYYTVAAFCKLSDGTIIRGPYNSTGVSAIPAAAPYSNVYATYSTKYSSSQVNRTTNLNIACKTINGTIVKPGQTFSFNDKLGVRSADKGYKPATIFTGSTGTAQELGGGICQVASTMFNTALLGNNTIVQRYQHSQKVNYCPVGRDAGIYYGSKDFKFKNNTNYNIKIKSWISGGTLTVQFLTTEQVKPPAVSLSVTRSGNTYTLKRTVGGKVNYTTKSTY